MVRVMLVLGLLVFVPAIIVFWRTREQDKGSQPVPSSTRPIGTSTISHGRQAPSLSPRSAHGDER